jgi:uracil-DNA glycosylase family 4
VEYRETVPPRASFCHQNYWRKPVPGFGDPHAWLLLTGLAPAAHGGNRTGRVFTGDESGRFLFDALYREGFANQSTSESLDDGLKLHDCYITASVKCAPPQNKPTLQEFINCQAYYQNELRLLKNLTHVLALGKLAFEAFLAFVKANGQSTKGWRFGHGAKYKAEHMPTLYASYHPTPRNTYTGTLTKEMFRELLKQIREDKQF